MQALIRYIVIPWKWIEMQSTAAPHIRSVQKEAPSQNLNLDFYKLFIPAVNGLNQGGKVECEVWKEQGLGTVIDVSTTWLLMMMMISAQIIKMLVIIFTKSPTEWSSLRWSHYTIRYSLQANPWL